MIKKIFKCFCLSACFATLLSFTALAGTWQPKDGKWKYREGDAYVTSKWVHHNNNWYYINQQGYMMTMEWHEEQGDWYFFDEQGAMLCDDTWIIEDTNYTFDSSGRLIDTQSTKGEWHGNTFINEFYNYSITIPEDYEKLEESFEDIHFIAMNDTQYIAVGIFDFAEDYGITLQDYLSLYYSDYQKSTVTINSQNYLKYHYSNDEFMIDSYIREADSNVLNFVALYEPQYQAEIDSIFQTIRR